MLKPRILASDITIAPASILTSGNSSFLAAFSHLSVHAPKIQRRAASHATQGRANKAAPGPGKRLGAKKTHSEPVVPGNIIFRQRGSLWFPGENCVMGRDHTISATAKGFVRYYRDSKRSDKKYIGVVFEQHETLPRPHNASRRRRLGMDAVVMERPLVTEGEKLAEDILLSEVPTDMVDEISTRAPSSKSQLSLRERYQYRESNWSIGRTAESRGIVVPPYDPNNRWAAWRKRVKRKVRARAKATVKANSKKGKKKSKR